MEAMSWQERITIDPAILVGKPVIKGTPLAVMRDQTATPYQQVEFSRSRRGFPISKGRLPVTSADVAHTELEPDAIG